MGGGDPLRRQRPHDGARVEAAVQHGGGAGEPERHLLDLAAHVEQRHDDQHAVAGPGVAVPAQDAGGFQKGPVAEHHALGHAGGAAGVDQALDVVRVHGHRRPRRAAAGEQGGVADRVAAAVAPAIWAVARPGIEGDDVAQAGPVAQRRGDLGRGRVEHQHLGQAVVDDAGELRCRQPPVQVDGDQPGGAAAGEDLEILRPVLRQDRHARLPLQPQGQQRVAEGEGPGREGGVAQAAPLELEGGPVAMQPGVAGDDVCGDHAHAGPPGMRSMAVAMPSWITPPSPCSSRSHRSTM